MKRLGSILLAVWPFAAQSQTVDVQTGDHADFTRLVLTIPPQSDWQVNRTPDGYRASLGPEIEGYDLSGAFDLISRERVGDLTFDGGALDIDVACDCHVDAFLYRPEYLVVDVIDGPPPETSDFETPLQQVEVVEDEPDGTETQTLSQPMGINLPVVVPSQTESSLIPDLPFSETLEAPRNANLIAAERAIIESFARAATQGVFDFPAIPVPPPIEDGEDRVQQTPISPLSDPMDGVPIPLEESDPSGPGFVLRTAIDREALTGEEDTPTNCPEGIELDMTDWAEPSGFSTIIPELRANLVNEAGDRDPAVARRLAKAYIYYGFGVEAREALSQIETPGETDHLLSLLSRIVDNEPVPVADLLPFRDCGPTMEAWLALASGRIDSSDDRISSAILVAHRGFPDPIRGHLGIRLTQAFAAAGMLHSASELLSYSTQTVTGESPEAAIAEADLIGAMEGPEAEIAQLDRIIERDPRATPETMVRLLDLSREAEVTVDDSVFEIADTMRFESDETETTVNLAEAEARVLIASNQPFAALDLLAGDIGPMPAEQEDALRSRAVENLARTADDEAFLTFVFSPMAHPISASATNALARRLIDLGFPAEAQPFLAGPAEGEDAAERDRLQAEASLMLSNFDQPTAATSDPQGTEEEPEANLETAWRDGAWETLSTSDDPLLSAASQAILSQTEAPTEATPLAERHELLDQAQATRSLANDLLERFSIEESEN